MSISLPFFPCALLWPLILLLTHATLSIGTITSATIDDSSGDSLNPGVMPVYSPPSAFSLNSDCSGCLIKADPAQAFDGTWHDSSQLPGEASVSITLSFTGTGIDVFCILANTVQGAATTTDLAFTLDGSPQQPFSHTPDSTFSYLYNQNVLSVSGLAQASHQLVITTDSSGSLLLFDYARYTFDDGLSPSAPPVTTTTQVTSVVTTTSIAQITASAPQKILSQTTQTTSSSVLTVVTSSSSTHPGSTSIGSTSVPSSASPSSSSTTLANTGSGPIFPSSILPASPSSSSSSLPPPTVNVSSSSGSGFKHVSLLVGTLIPILLIAAAGIIFWRRRRARRARMFESESQSYLSTTPIFGSQHRPPTDSAYHDHDAFLHGAPSIVSTVESNRALINSADNVESPLGWADPRMANDDANDWGTQTRSMQERNSLGVSPGPYTSSTPYQSSLSTSDYFPTSPPPGYDSQPRPLPTIPSTDSQYTSVV